MVLVASGRKTIGMRANFQIMCLMGLGPRRIESQTRFPRQNIGLALKLTDLSM